ncbi:MAG TPA: DinB family protein [Cyclobacteriaceae bacterium]|nr:DinB family protein [Cyclobacteriaceae bacterium]
MKATAKELKSIVEEYAKKLAHFSEEEMATKPNPKKWSKKEIVGHLIDSGQNNLRRFIVGQYESIPPKIVYEQDFWVSASGYQSMKAKDVIELWRLVNLQICQVLNNMNPDHYDKSCDSGKGQPSIHTLEWLADDYVKHLKHHINQIITASFDIVYP